MKNYLSQKKDNNKLNEIKYEELKTKNSPPGRRETSIVYYKNKIYLFSACCQFNYNDPYPIYCLNLLNNKWIPLYLPHKTNNILNKQIEGHTIHIWKNYFIICFGRNNNGILIINLNNNYKLNFIPLYQRKYHSSIIINDKLLISGGFGKNDFDYISVILLKDLILNKKISMTKINIKFKSTCQYGMAYFDKKLFFYTYRNNNKNIIVNNIFNSNKMSILRNPIEISFKSRHGFVIFVLKDLMEINVIIHGGYSHKCHQDAYCFSFYTNKLNIL